MFVVPCKWRELLPPEAQERFDDVNEQRVLGASSHIRIIGDIFLSIAENGADDPLPLLRGIADHFIATRGESSQAITNAIGLMLRNVHGSSRAELAQSIRKGVECYRTEAAKDLEKIRSLLWTVLEGKRTLLLYDYSSTVGAGAWRFVPLHRAREPRARRRQALCRTAAPRWAQRPCHSGLRAVSIYSGVRCRLHRLRDVLSGRNML